MADYRELYEILGRAIDECFIYLDKEDALSALQVLINARLYCVCVEEKDKGTAE